MARETGTQTVQEEVCTETSHSKSGTVLRTSTPDMLYCAVFMLVYSLNEFPSLLPRNCHLKCELTLFFYKDWTKLLSSSSLECLHFTNLTLCRHPLNYVLHAQLS